MKMRRPPAGRMSGELEDWREVVAMLRKAINGRLSTRSKWGTSCSSTTACLLITVGHCVLGFWRGKRLTAL